jgi:hypothetical protein
VGQSKEEFAAFGRIELYPDRTDTEPYHSP